MKSKLNISIFIFGITLIFANSKTIFANELEEIEIPSIVEETTDTEDVILTEEGYYIKHTLFLEKPMGVYENINAHLILDILEPQVVEIIEEVDNWILIETWLGLKWINLDYMQASIFLDVPILNQRNLGYPTGCEIISLAMMIDYETDVDIKTLISEMPISYDPNLGFRGNPATNSGFTIFPSALLDLTEGYLGNSHDMTGSSIEDLKNKLNSNIPVVVWINGLGFNVHAICLAGYDEKGFYYNDPWTGVKDSFINYEDFYKIWDKPIYDAQLKITYEARKAISYYN